MSVEGVGTAPGPVAEQPPLGVVSPAGVVELVPVPGIDPAVDRFRTTDVGNAARLAFRHGQDLAWVKGLGGWMVWDGRRWAADEADGVMARAIDAVKWIPAEARQALDEDTAKELFAWGVKSQAKERLLAAEVLARSRLAARPEDFDADPFLLNVANGVVDLRSGQLLPHDRELRLSKLAGVVYDPEAQAPTWVGFLERIFAGDQGLVDFAQRWVGYGATGDTSEQFVVVFFGEGANGKSTFLETVSHVLGDYARKTPSETLVDRRADRIPADLARLRGARFVHASEAEAEGRLAESIVKQVSGGDSVTARHLYGHWFEYRPCFKVVLSVNHRPVVKGGDWGIWRRILLVPFSVVIPAEEQDKRLPEKLRAEASGILTWIVQGAGRWFEDGLRIPEAITTASAQYRAEMDPVGRWIEERCDVGEGLWTSNEALGASYTVWAGENDAGTLSTIDLGKRLEGKGFAGDRRRVDGKQVRGRHGLAPITVTGREAWNVDD